MARRTERIRRTKILDAAETSFADHGYNGASMRAIVHKAGVNLATVYYYFGSKNGLMEAVLKRRFGPLRLEHLELLRQFECEAHGRPLTVEKILEAMLLPPLRLVDAPTSKRRAMTRLVGRIVTEPDTQTQEILRDQRSEVRKAFLKALRASLPGIPLADLRWRMEFLWGALAFILCNPQTIEVENRRERPGAQGCQVLDQMVAFFSAGFRVPVHQRN